MADLRSFWDGERHIKLLDPNLLAASEHMELLGQLSASGAWVDFTQGLDARLLTEENIDLLNACKVKMLHFAWDNPRDESIPRQLQFFAERTSIWDYRRRRVYLLTNYWSTHAEDLASRLLAARAWIRSIRHDLRQAACAARDAPIATMGKQQDYIPIL